jgi:phosphoserine phosphatase
MYYVPQHLEGGQMHELQAELQRFKRDTQYYEAHREELLTQYPEQWVAVFDQQVVSAAPDFEQLLEMLEQNGIPLERTLIEHVTRKEELLIL